jgi:hypothetical protein
MGRGIRLRKLLVYGGVQVAGMSLAVLGTLASIYIGAIHFGAERKSSAIAKSGCMPSHCRLRVSSTR